MNSAALAALLAVAAIAVAAIAVALIVSLRRASRSRVVAPQRNGQAPASPLPSVSAAHPLAAVAAVPVSAMPVAAGLVRPPAELRAVDVPALSPPAEMPAVAAESPPPSADASPARADLPVVSVDPPAAFAGEDADLAAGAPPSSPSDPPPTLPMASVEPVAIADPTPAVFAAAPAVADPVPIAAAEPASAAADPASAAAPAAEPSALPAVIRWSSEFDPRSGPLDPISRLRLIGDLGVIAQDWCVPLLAGAYLEESHASHRQAALISLAACRSTLAVPTLRLAATCDNAAERAIAADALADLEPPPRVARLRFVQRY